MKGCLRRPAIAPPVATVILHPVPAAADIHRSGVASQRRQVAEPLIHQMTAALAVVVLQLAQAHPVAVVLRASTGVRMPGMLPPAEGPSPARPAVAGQATRH